MADGGIEALKMCAEAVWRMYSMTFLSPTTKPPSEAKLFENVPVVR